MTKAELKTSIAAAIYENETEDIGGDALQEKLFEIVDACFPVMQNILITVDDFEGDSYQNDLLIGKTPDIDFELFTNNGSGVMLKVAVGYTHDTAYGIIVATAQNYKLKIIK